MVLERWDAFGDQKRPKTILFFFWPSVFLDRFFSVQKKTIFILGHISTPHLNRFLWVPHSWTGQAKLPMGQYGPFSHKPYQSFSKFEKPKKFPYDKIMVFLDRALYGPPAYPGSATRGWIKKERLSKSSDDLATKTYCTTVYTPLQHRVEHRNCFLYKMCSVAVFFSRFSFWRQYFC